MMTQWPSLRIAGWNLRFGNLEPISRAAVVMNCTPVRNDKKKIHLYRPLLSGQVAPDMIARAVFQPALFGKLGPKTVER
jgi:hypothetical protein